MQRGGRHLTSTTPSCLAAKILFQQWLISTAVPLVSIVLALTMPGPWMVLAGLIYGSFGLLMPWHHKRRERLWGARQGVAAE